MARNDQGWTPLHGAAGQNTNPGATALLIEAGADFEAGVDYKWSAHYMSTPLHLAAGFNDNPTVVTDLIEAGADIESHNYYVGTPLIMAAEFNDNPLVIAALLDAGADQKAQADLNETVWSITMRNPDWVGHLFYGLLRTLEWQRAAPVRTSKAQLRLGLIYHEGQSVARDYSEAARWYREAAKQGRATAQLALAFMLNAGRGVAKDEMASFRWLSRAAEHGHVEAQFMLSIYHNHDMVRSHAWLIVAASQGHKIAISMLDVNRSIRPAEVVAQAEELATDLCQGMDNPSSC